MADATTDTAGEGLESRPPSASDLASLCRGLNEQGARYLVCGGFAMIHAGYPRFTADIDLLVEDSDDNEGRVFAALERLPDKAVRELDRGDLHRYTVLRVSDEITVDVMASASGIRFDETGAERVMGEVEGVLIPFASPRLLLRMKSCTHREKDQGDVAFLRHLLGKPSVDLE